MKTAATSVPDYLASLPPERRAVVSAVRDAVRRRMPAGYEEALAWGAITWQVPLSRYPDTYNGQPLCYVSLAAQKGHYALYLMSAYMNPAHEQRLRDGFARAGLKLDMGKSCVRFKRLDDVELGVIGDLIAAATPEDFIARYEESRGAASSAAARRSAARKAAPTRAAGKATKAATKKPAGAKKPAAAKRPAGGAESPARRAP